MARGGLAWLPSHSKLAVSRAGLTAPLSSIISRSMDVWIGAHAGQGSPSRLSVDQHVRLLSLPRLTLDLIQGGARRGCSAGTDPVPASLGAPEAGEPYATQYDREGERHQEEDPGGGAAGGMKDGRGNV